LTHGGDVTRCTAFLPRFEAVRGCFQVPEKMRVLELLPALRQNALDEFPNAEELSVGFKEEVFMEKPVMEQRASLFPIPEHHVGEGAGLRAVCRDAHGLIETLRMVFIKNQSRAWRNRASRRRSYICS
jgi:hypothetical protein